MDRIKDQRRYVNRKKCHPSPPAEYNIVPSPPPSSRWPSTDQTIYDCEICRGSLEFYYVRALTAFFFLSYILYFFHKNIHVPLEFGRNIMILSISKVRLRPSDSIHRIYDFHNNNNIIFCGYFFALRRFSCANCSGSAQYPMLCNNYEKPIELLIHDHGPKPTKDVYYMSGGTNKNVTTFDKLSPWVFTRFISQQFSGKIIIVHLIRFDNCQVVLISIFFQSIPFALSHILLRDSLATLILSRPLYNHPLATIYTICFTLSYTPIHIGISFFVIALSYTFTASRFS